MVAGRKYYSRKDYVMRALWAIAMPLFRFSPRPIGCWRNGLLRAFGARIGKQVVIFPSVRITFPWNLSIGDRSVISWGVRIYNLDALEIGNRVVISQHAHLCGGTHDYESADFPLCKRKIWIEDDVWIGADAFVGPGVRIRRGAVVAARSVVVKDVSEQMVVGGNPVRLLKLRNRREQR